MVETDALKGLQPYLLDLTGHRVELQDHIRMAIPVEGRRDVLGTFTRHCHAWANAAYAYAAS